MPELLERLPQWGALALPPDVDKRLRQASRPTLARRLAPARAQYPRRGATTTRPGTLLKPEIPIRTFTEALYQRLNPLQLRRDLDAALERPWTLAAPDPRRAPGDTQEAP